MITVVHIITKLEMGGAQENTLYTCEHLDRSSFRVALLFGPGGVYDPQALAIPNAHIEPLPELVRELSLTHDTRCMPALVRSIRSLHRAHLVQGHAPTNFIVHTHSSKAGILGRFAARAARVPHVLHTIHGFGFHEGQMEAAKQLFIGAELAASRCTDAFISVSRANLAEAQARGIVRSEHRVRVIRSGFPLEEFFAAADHRDEARIKLGIAKDAEVIVSIANFKPQKDPLTFVEAIRRVLRERPRAICLYAGDGELRGDVEFAIKSANIGDRFQLLGWREDIPDLLAASNVVALSSRFEGLPRSAVQAVATRRTFVGTRVDGTPEIIRDGKNGYLVPPSDAAALAAGIIRALDTNPVDDADRQNVMDWDATRMVRAQEQFYREICN